jgi:hypothetical protein
VFEFKDVKKMSPSQFAAYRIELHKAAMAAEEEAARLWKAYWQSCGLPTRPLTPEQLDAKRREVKAVKAPTSRRNSTIQVTLS